MKKTLQLRNGLENLAGTGRNKGIPAGVMIGAEPPIDCESTIKAPTRVLLAEDSALYRHLISGHLKEWGFDFVVAKDGDEAWEALQLPDAPSLALLDWVLPRIEGIELCRKIRQAGANKHYTYVVLLTGKDAKSDLIEGMEAGADDYLVKPFDPPELKARLFAGKRILDLQRELVVARETIRLAASRDSLTGLLNRGELVNHLEREIDRGKRENSPLGIILADIDHFKNVNDSLGHLAGDIVLQEVARRLRSDLRAYDWAGRYGGEEFLLILPGCDLAATLRRANEIRQLVSATEITTANGNIRVTVSMGVTSAACPRNGCEQILLNEADVALYRAKHNGRNRVEAAEFRPDCLFASGSEKEVAARIRAE